MLISIIVGKELRNVFFDCVSCRFENPKFFTGVGKKSNQ